MKEIKFRGKLIDCDFVPGFVYGAFVPDALGGISSELYAMWTG